MESPDLALQMRKLDFEFLQIREFAEESFATKHDHTSQIRYMGMLCDKHETAYLLHYASYKSRQVARSVLDAENYALADTYDFTYCAKRDLECILDSTIPHEVYTGSQSLFDVITKCSLTQERRPMIELQAARDAYKHRLSHNRVVMSTFFMFYGILFFLFAGLPCLCDGFLYPFDSSFSMSFASVLQILVYKG